MARLMLVVCVVLAAAMVVQAKPAKREELKAIRKALKRAIEKEASKRQLAQDSSSDGSSSGFSSSSSDDSSSSVGSSSSSSAGSSSSSAGYSSLSWWPESWSSLEWKESWSDLFSSDESEESDWEWPQSWGPMPDWAPDSWRRKRDQKDDEAKPGRERDRRPKPGSAKVGERARTLRDHALKSRALKRHLAEAKTKRQELTEPQWSEGSGSSSDFEWKDSWSEIEWSDGSDLSEWEWPESWGPVPSWVPDSWFETPEEKDDEKKPGLDKGPKPSKLNKRERALRVRALKTRALKRHLADEMRKREQLLPVDQAPKPRPPKPVRPGKPGKPDKPAPPPEPEDEPEGSGLSSEVDGSDSSDSWDWPESWSEKLDARRIQSLLTALKKRKLEA